MERRSHQTDLTLMVKISQTQTPVGSIQGGVPLSRVNTNPEDDDVKLCIERHISIVSAARLF